MLVRRLWQLSEAGDPAFLLGRPAEDSDQPLFEKLLEQGVLRHAGRQTTWNTCVGCDCGREDRPIRWIDNHPVAVCVADRGHDEVLVPDDLTTFELMIPALVSAAAAASGFAGQSEEVVPGIWRLGAGSDGRVLHLIPTRRALLRPGLVGSLRQTEPIRDLLVLGPSLERTTTGELARQGIEHRSVSEAVGTRRLPHPLALDLSLPFTGMAVQPRLLLQIATKSVTFDDRSVKLPARRFELLVLLAQGLLTGKPILSASAIGAAMFGNTTSDARPRGLVSELREQLRKTVQAPDNLIENRSGLGYALTLRTTEVSIQP